MHMLSLLSKARSGAGREVFSIRHELNVPSTTAFLGGYRY